MFRFGAEKKSFMVYINIYSNSITDQSSSKAILIIKLFFSYYVIKPYERITVIK